MMQNSAITNYANLTRTVHFYKSIVQLCGKWNV